MALALALAMTPVTALAMALAMVVAMAEAMVVVTMVAIYHWRLHAGGDLNACKPCSPGPPSGLTRSTYRSFAGHNGARAIPTPVVTEAKLASGHKGVGGVTLGVARRTAGGAIGCAG